MKRTVRAQTALILVVTILLAGCAKSDPIPQKADFSFPLPEGYSLADETEEDCAIADKDGRAVGGFAVTMLRRRDLKDSNTKNILRYLQGEFHKTNNVEFMAMHGGEEDPFVTVTMIRHSDDFDEQRHFDHTFFEHGSMVYHLWLDCDLLDEEAVHEIKSTVFPE